MLNRFKTDSSISAEYLFYIMLDFYRLYFVAMLLVKIVLF